MPLLPHNCRWRIYRDLMIPLGSFDAESTQQMSQTSFNWLRVKSS
jgi:hypothetical protein